MNAKDMPRFAQWMKLLGDTYGHIFTEDESEFYWRMLQPYSIDEIDQAIAKHLASPKYCQWMPKVGDILRWLEPSDEIRSLEAWSLVARAISTVGAYDSVVFEDPLIHAVICSMGGWITLCHSACRDLPFRAQEFQKRYQGILTIPPQETPPYLCGILEHTRSASGYPPPQPRCIASKQQSLATPRVSPAHAPSLTWKDSSYE